MQTRARRGLPDAVILDGRDPANYVIAEEDRAARRAPRAGRGGRGRRPGRPALVPGRARPRAGGAARAARRRTRRHPRDPRHRGGRQRLRARPADRGERAAMNFALTHVGRTDLRERAQASELPPLLRRAGGLVHRDVDAADRRVVARPAAHALGRRRRRACARSAPAGDGVRSLRRHDPRPLRRPADGDRLRVAFARHGRRPRCVDDCRRSSP